MNYLLQIVIFFKFGREMDKNETILFVLLQPQKYNFHLTIEQGYCGKNNRELAFSDER
jgi:hypothetical protein